MRRLKPLRNDQLSLGCIYLLLASTVNGYILGPTYLNDIEKAENFDDGGVPHKRASGRQLQEGPEENVDRGTDDGDMGFTDEGNGGYVHFAEAPPKFVEARQHGKVLLECTATGTPGPQIKWYKNGKPLHKV